LSTLNFSSALQQNLPSAVLLLAADSRRWRVLTTTAIATLLLLLLLVATEPLQVGDTSATADDLD